MKIPRDLSASDPVSALKQFGYEVTRQTGSHPFKALIFDFNGLIVDDEPIHFSLFKKVLADEEIELTEKNYWETYLGYDDKGLVEAIYKKEGKKLSPKKVAELVDKKATLYLPALNKKFRFFPGVLDLIHKAHKKFLLAVVSGALRNEIEFVLQKGGVLDCFSVIVSANETKHGKPSPEGFVTALAQLKKINPEIRPENCLVLEDSHAGIEAAERAHMSVVALTHTYPRAELKNVDWVADNFEEVWEIVNG